jgi:formamidopyrimidine-DNA glycosylase
VPELPEAEFGRALVEAVAVGKTITNVTVQPDRIVFCGASRPVVVRALLGRTIDAARRRGKYIWVELDRRPWPVFHFGMTGAFRVRGVVPLKYRSHGRSVDDVWPPRFAKLRLELEDGTELVFTNARRLGRVRLVSDPLAEPPVVSLGFDPLTDMPDLREFRRRFAARKGVVKGLLLDQSFCAGVGNWIADEVLYQARIAPARRAPSLDADEVKAVHRAIKTVIRVAVSVDARKDAFPAGWLFHRRWGKDPDARDRDGLPLRFETIAGRTTAWVPARQR